MNHLHIISYTNGDNIDPLDYIILAVVMNRVRRHLDQ